MNPKPSKKPSKSPPTKRSVPYSPKPARRRKTRAEVSLEQELDKKVLELTETNRQLKRKIFDLYTVFEISRNFNSVLNYQSLLDSFIFTCLGQVGALKGAIFLKREGEKERLYFTKAKGSGGFPDDDAFLGIGSELVQYVTQLNRPVPTGHLLKGIATEYEREILAHFDPGLVVPLIYQTRLSGVFMIAEKISNRDFLMDDIEFLSILGNQIAVAIENARLYEDERRAMQQLQKAQDQLVHSERLAALGDMSAKVAHEINNPLGIIKNYLLLIRRSAGEPEGCEKNVGVVEQEIDRIARIIRQLLEFHRPTEVEMQPTDLVQQVDEILTLMERLLSSHHIEIVRDYGRERPKVIGVADNLRQVFMNLIINARDAMKEGGTLRVGLGTENGTVTVSFADSGPGIPPNVIPRIFEPFFTTKSPGEGTGLGLSVCYGIIKSHNGTITFRNTDTGGCFDIRLPIVQRKDSDESGD